MFLVVIWLILLWFRIGACTAVRNQRALEFHRQAADVIKSNGKMATLEIAENVITVLAVSGYFCFSFRPASFSVPNFAYLKNSKKNNAS